MKNNDIYKLKRCLRDFKTKDHLCLFLDLFIIWMSFQNGLLCPSVLGLGFSFLFFFLHLVEHHHISYFCEKLNSFGPFGFFFLHAPSFVWTLLMIENFLLCPQCCLDTFNHWGFFCLLHLPPVWGVILAKVIFKNITRLKRGPQMIYFSLVKRLWKMAFLHSKCMHLGLVSLAYMRICKVISHYSFK